MRRGFTLLDTLVSIIIIATCMLILLQLMMSSRINYYTIQGSATTYREAANFINISHSQKELPYNGMQSTYTYSPHQVKDEGGNYIDTGETVVSYTKTDVQPNVTNYAVHNLTIRTSLPNTTETLDHTIEVLHEEL